MSPDAMCHLESNCYLILHGTFNLVFVKACIALYGAQLFATQLQLNDPCFTHKKSTTLYFPTSWCPVHNAAELQHMTLE